MPVGPQFRPVLATPLAAPHAPAQSCTRPATATGLDHQSMGAKEVCTIGPATDAWH